MVRRVLEEMARRRREEAERIGARIAELREGRHLTQPAAAERLHVALRTYQTWEAGDATPRWHNLERIAKFYGITVEQILGAEQMLLDGGAQSQLDRIEAKVDALAEILTTLADELTAENLVRGLEADAELDEPLRGSREAGAHDRAQAAPTR